MRLKITLFRIFVVFTVLVTIGLSLWAVLSFNKKINFAETILDESEKIAEKTDDTAPTASTTMKLVAIDKILNEPPRSVDINFDFTPYKNINSAPSSSSVVRENNLPVGIVDAIQWIEPKKIGKLGFFGTDLDKDIDSDDIWANPEKYPAEFYLSLPYYLGGVFEYDGKPGAVVYGGTYCANCPVRIPNLTFLLYDNKVTMLASYVLSGSMDAVAWDRENITGSMVDFDFVYADFNFKFPYLYFPALVDIAGKGRFSLYDVYGAGSESKPSVVLDSSNFIFSVLGMGDWYWDSLDNRFFYVRGRDNLIRVYMLRPDFVADDEGGSVKVNDESGALIGNYYYLNQSACFRSRSPIIVNPNDIKISDLVLVGYLNNGDKIYELTNNNHNLLKEFYDVVFYPGQEGGGKLSYNEFVAQHPLLFWQDQFGRLTELRLTNFQPMAECGKPVIYLYPTKTTKVKVQLQLSKLTVSEPEYGNGWEVVAEPNGQLTEIKSGAKYSYLFWEGLGAGEAEPSTAGFNVKKENISKFLDEKLAVQGLNKKEIADFKEFWLPKMQSAPYYFVTFYGTSDMNKIAPLAVSPRPDTVIRVLMDYRAVSAPLDRPEQKLSALLRKGFTVIEWGGVLYK